MNERHSEGGFGSTLTNQRGVSLIEVLVAGFITMLVVSSALVMIPKIQRGLISAQQGKDSVSLATGMLNGYKASSRRLPLTSESDLRGLPLDCPDSNPGSFEHLPNQPVTIHGTKYNVYSCLVQKINQGGTLVPVSPDHPSTALVTAKVYVKRTSTAEQKTLTMETLINRDAATPTGRVTVTVVHEDMQNPGTPSDELPDSVIGSTVSLYIPGMSSIHPFYQIITQGPPNNTVTFTVPEGIYFLKVNQTGYFPSALYPVEVSANNTESRTVYIRAFDEYGSKAVTEVFAVDASPIVSMIVRETQHGFQCTCASPTCSCPNIPNELIVLANPTQSPITLSQIKIEFYDASGDPRATLDGSAAPLNTHTPTLLVDVRNDVNNGAAGQVTCHNPSNNTPINCSEKVIPSGGYFLIEGLTTGTTAPWNRTDMHPDISYDVALYDLLVATSPAAVRVYNAGVLTDTVGIKGHDGAIPPDF